jgi:hypothetical protein
MPSCREQLGNLGVGHELQKFRIEGEGLIGL